VPTVGTDPAQIVGTLGCGRDLDMSAAYTALPDRGVAQPGSAPALGAGGRGFKSPLPDHIELFKARSGRADSRSTERGTVSWLVRRYVAGRTDITLQARESSQPWSLGAPGDGGVTVELSVAPVDVDAVGGMPQMTKPTTGRGRSMAFM
jgi:hypothetical protein